jgi:hypothetical protein
MALPHSVFPVRCWLNVEQDARGSVIQQGRKQDTITRDVSEANLK